VWFTVIEGKGRGHSYNATASGEAVRADDRYDCRMGAQWGQGLIGPTLRSRFEATDMGNTPATSIGKILRTAQEFVLFASILGHPKGHRIRATCGCGSVKTRLKWSLKVLGKARGLEFEADLAALYEGLGRDLAARGALARGRVTFRGADSASPKCNTGC